jgi:glutathione S-transferase
VKISFSGASPFVRKCMVVAHETGLATRIDKVDTTVTPVAVNEAYQRQAPIAKVPALTTDDGAVLYDSRVISEYLDSLHQGPKLFPAAGAARWTALRRLALGDGICDAAVLNRYETFLRPEEKRWPEWTEGQMRKVRGGLTALEGEAASFGNGVDIGLIAIGCALGYLDFRYPGEKWRDKHPKLAGWFEGFSKRPSMVETAPK